jgi:hypothetical protein
MEVAMLGGRGKRGVEGVVRTSKGQLILLEPEGGVGRLWPANKKGRKCVALWWLFSSHGGVGWLS